MFFKLTLLALIGAVKATFTLQDDPEDTNAPDEWDDSETYEQAVAREDGSAAQIDSFAQVDAECDAECVDNTVESESEAEDLAMAQIDEETDDEDFESEYWSDIGCSYGDYDCEEAYLDAQVFYDGYGE